jgi:hypothetical protein
MQLPAQARPPTISWATTFTITALSASSPAGRDDLARRVVWASRDIGDGLGFDILSFDDADDTERMLEVKTTGLGKFSCFYVTGNELRWSEDIPQPGCQ